jgi:hypothetical protein
VHQAAGAGFVIRHHLGADAVHPRRDLGYRALLGERSRRNERGKQEKRGHE